MLGPCFFDPLVDPDNPDMSEGEDGIPTVFAIRVVSGKNGCRRMKDVRVDIWHTNSEGLYSGDSTGVDESPNTFPGFGWNANFCAGAAISGQSADQRALASRWHRGARITNSEGIAYFLSCFPGWYTDRTNHIHLRFSMNNRVSLATQLAFPDSLNEDVFNNHPEYKPVARGYYNYNQDGVFRGAASNWQMDVKRQEDGSMLAHKTVILNV